ncbi:hypothetical protein GQ53DRAFT_845252 [Thozetella sp. PMI_491]|nr:hypothetical protein GQ53DRAFT_845252 [Thozetella sp. PMI_491]
MQTRLKHLESLVKGAMESQPSQEPIDPEREPHPPLPDLAPQLQSHTEICASNASGRVVLGPNDTTYVGATHWAAMLDDIEEMKGYFNEIEEEASPGSESVRPDVSLLFNNIVPPTAREDLFSRLPERNVVNGLVSRYFNSNSPALHIIHKPTFQRNYRKFWADPRGSPISFLALIYSIMCLGTFAALGAGEKDADTGGTPTEMMQLYRRCCAQCLALSNYAKHPGPYTPETFLLYMECELVLSKGDQMSCYLIISVVIRLALRMGLHRDSDKVEGSITPYQGEIRRRVWHLLVQMDLLVSFHNGLPSMVQAVKSDTRVPLNLQDQDFDEDSTELPPSRPETEITGMSYALAKGRLARVFGKIIEQANLLTLPDYAEVTALDRELQQAFSATPHFLRFVPMDLCITDSAELIIRRLSLEVLFQKARCILHRKYLTKKKETVEFSNSKKVAIDASRELLRIQSEVHETVQPGGVLCKDSWIISSLVMHDLLLAAVIIYLCLMQEREGVSLTGNRQIPNAQQAEMIAALEGSCTIWSETRSMSIDTGKAHDVLGSMLKRLDSIFQRPRMDGAPGHNTRESMSRLSLSEPVHLPEGSADAFGQFDGGQYEGLGDVILFPSPTMQSNISSGSAPIDIIGDLTNTLMDFDWDVFDNHVRKSHANDQSWPDISFQDINFGDDYNYSP